jgi:hypothetical protein
VESLGIDAANSKGTAHTPGASGSYSAYSTIGTSTKRYLGLQMGVQMSGTVVVARAYNGRIGRDGAQLPGSHDFYWKTSTAEQANRCGGGPLQVDLPSGTGIQFSATSSGTADACNVAFYGVY